jgi:glucosylceramidase
MKARTHRQLALVLLAGLVVFIIGPASIGRGVRAAPVGTTVSRWQTSQAGDRLTSKASLTFTTDDTSNLPTIQITPTRYYQAIDGFGGTFNEAGYVVLSTLSTTAQSAVLTQLFDPNSGAGFTLTRVPLGGDDFSCTDLNNTCPEYTDDDIGSGTDFNMTQFSISRDQLRLIPFVLAAKAHGTFRIFASPWSSPAWMKTNGSLDNGGSVIAPSTNPSYYSANALYFQKYVQALGQHGVPIDFVSVQNEPQNSANYMSTIWASSDMATFVANYLGPQFANNSVGARIRIYEHNRDTWQYPKQVLDNTATAPYVAGVDFHDYECTFGQTYCMPDNVGLFNDSHPGYSVWMGEHTDVGVPNPSDYLNGEKWGNWITNDMNSGMGGYVYWNLILDSAGGPVEVPKSSYQDPLVDIDTSTGTVYYMPRFWYLAQFSKFVRPGAYRIGADGAQLYDGLNFTAFKNADGSEVVVVVNSNSTATQVKIREDGNVIEPTLDAHSINTFKWTAPVNTFHVIAGGSTGWNSIASDPYGPDAYYTGGGTATNIHSIAGTADAPLYQPERNGNFSYAFPVPNGRYQVALKFSENYWNCSNCRLFNVSVQGNQVLTNFDIYAAAGGQYKALDKIFVANITGGYANLQFTGVTDKAKVDAIAITPLPTEGSAFKTMIGPGYVLAENYNTGGAGYAYQFAQSGGTDFSYRSDAINLQKCSNDPECGDDLSWLSTGDWVNYTVNDVSVGGNYDIDFRVASSNAGGQMSLDVDGVNLVPTTSVPNTHGSQSWTDVLAYGVNLSPGVHTFKFHVVTGGFSFLDFFLKKVTRLDVLPTTVEAEWYAGGGEGLGYHDTTSGNSFTTPYPGYYRPEDVDLEISSTHGYDDGNTANGEWLRYDVWLPSSKTVTVTFAVASIYTSGQFRLDLDTQGHTVGSTLSVPNTGGWQNWQTVSESVTLPSGNHILYWHIVSGGFNFNYMTFS